MYHRGMPGGVATSSKSNVTLTYSGSTLETMVPVSTTRCAPVVRDARRDRRVVSKAQEGGVSSMVRPRYVEYRDNVCCSRSKQNIR